MFHSKCKKNNLNKASLNFLLVTCSKLIFARCSLIFAHCLLFLLVACYVFFVACYFLLVQNVWNKSQTKMANRTFWYLLLGNFWPLLPKCYFWKEDWRTKYCHYSILRFLEAGNKYFFPRKLQCKTSFGIFKNYRWILTTQCYFYYFT